MGTNAAILAQAARAPVWFQLLAFASAERLAVLSPPSMPASTEPEAKRQHTSPLVIGILTKTICLYPWKSRVMNMHQGDF